MLYIALVIGVLYNLMYCVYAKGERGLRGIWPAAFLCLSCAALLAATLFLLAFDLSVY